MECAGWSGHGARSDGAALGVHPLAGHRGHVPRVHSAALREERSAEIAAQATRRQRHRLRRLPGGGFDGFLAGLHQISLSAHVHPGPGVAQVAQEAHQVRGEPDS